MLYFKKMSKRQNVRIYTHRTKISSPEGEVTISPAGSSLLQLSVLQGKKNRAHSLYFCEKSEKIFTIICSFVYVTYVIEETFIGVPSPPGDLLISKLEPQLKFNRLVLEKKNIVLYLYFLQEWEMKTVKWYFKKKTILKNRVHSLPFSTLLLMMTVREKKGNRVHT